MGLGGDGGARGTAERVERGIKQRVVLHFVPALSNPGFMEIRVELVRLAGEEGMWKRLNKGFLNDLRKQLLIWRSLDEEARLSYEACIVKTYPAYAAQTLANSGSGA